MILVTRDQKNSIITAKELESQGFKTIIAPLFEVIFCKINLLRRVWFKFFDFNAVILSSANSIKYLQKLNFDKNIQIYAVGEKTAAILKDYGYQNVLIANNSASSLLELITYNALKNDKFLYLCQKNAAGNIDLYLREKGYNIKKILAYKIKAKNHLSKAVISKMVLGKINAVTIYSNNSADIFCHLLVKYNIFAVCKNIKLLCFSDEICQYCQNIGFLRVVNIKSIKKRSFSKDRDK